MINSNLSRQIDITISILLVNLCHDKAFPGKIYLPAQLYRKQATNRSSTASSNRDSTALPDWGSPIEGGMVGHERVVV